MEIIPFPNVQGIKLKETRPPIGCWIIADNLRVDVYGREPWWVHRYFALALLGWEWYLYPKS